ncbi:peptidase-like protein [Calothrix sp. NIES-2100]|uniref:choice-of-anchor K domain-containing protein n=1 Tax=Calothrix sp. NIES-2100 TaxID=1954172 RepID=UPI000B5EA781|nr:peptidase-like protein [Calothrix sp. NIES-2100]
MNISLVFATALSGCSMLALAALGFSSPAQAFTISGNANGVWSNPIPDDDNKFCSNISSPTCFISGVGTNSFSWGEVAKSASVKKPNQLTFTGTNFSAKDGSWFKIGSLDYYNGLIYADTNVKKITLNLDLSFGNDSQVNTLPVTFNLVNTTNIGNIKDIANADRVEFATPLPSTSFKYNLDSYQFEIRGFSPSLFQPKTSISAIEEESASPGDIYAKISYLPPPNNVPPKNDVPEPSTIAGSCLAGIYLASRKKFSKQKAKSSCG